MGEHRRSSRSNLISRVFAGLVVVTLGLMAWAMIGVSRPPPWKPHQESLRNATGLFQALDGFVSVYKALPPSAPKSGELIMEGKDGVELLTVLLGKEQVSESMQNKKQIRFLNVEETKLKNKGGLLFSGTRSGSLPEGLYDSWGNPFRVRFASGEPFEIADPFKPGETIHGKPAIVFSYGKNGKPGDRDDIKTW